MTARVGQRVLYYPAADEPAGTDGKNPLAGIVAYAQEHTVNLGVLDMYGHMYSRLDVAFVEEGDKPLSGAYCEPVLEVNVPPAVPLEEEEEEHEEEPKHRKHQRRR